LSKMPGPRIGRAPWKTSSRSRQAEPIIDLLRNPVREDDRDLAILNWMIVGIYGVLTFAGSRVRGCRCVSRSRSGTVSHRTTAECGSRAAVRPGIGRAPARADLLSSGPCRPPLCRAAVLWRSNERSIRRSVTAIAAPQAAPSNAGRHFHQNVASALSIGGSASPVTWLCRVFTKLAKHI